MTPEKLSLIESKLTAAVLKAKQKGLRIRFGGFGIKTTKARQLFEPMGDCVCPIGALLLGTVCPEITRIGWPPASAAGYNESAALILGIHEDDVISFTCGFDHGAFWDANIDTNCFRRLGARFRQRITS